MLLVKMAMNTMNTMLVMMTRKATMKTMLVTMKATMLVMMPMLDGGCATLAVVGSRRRCLSVEP